MRDYEKTTGRVLLFKRHKGSEMTEVNLSIGEVISLVGLLLSFVVFLSTLIWNLWRKVMELSTRVSIVQQSCKDELHIFQAAVAEKYVNHSRLIEMEKKVLLSEERIHNSLDSLTSRIDRLIERVERKDHGV